MRRPWSPHPAAHELEAKKLSFESLHTITPNRRTMRIGNPSAVSRFPHEAGETPSPLYPVKL